jgi:methylmalonyl-CoA/ethylmalonyl-CoA epimerase
MKLVEIDHIGIAIRDIKKGSEFYEECLNLNVSESIDVPSQKVRIAFMEIGGTKLELIQPLGEDSPVAKFIQKKGEGLHHICFLVDDIEKALNELKDKKVKLVDQKPRTGATGKRIAFLHPESSSGVLIELKER